MKSRIRIQGKSNLPPSLWEHCYNFRAWKPTQTAGEINLLSYSTITHLTIKSTGHLIYNVFSVPNTISGIPWGHAFAFNNITNERNPKAQT